MEFLKPPNKDRFSLAAKEGKDHLDGTLKELGGSGKGFGNKADLNPNKLKSDDLFKRSR